MKKENMDILEHIKQGIYSRTLTEDDVLKAISEAKEDVKSRIQNSCEHDFVGVDDGYYYETCCKCGKFKQ